MDDKGEEDGKPVAVVYDIILTKDQDGKRKFEAECVEDAEAGPSQAKVAREDELREVNEIRTEENVAPNEISLEIEIPIANEMTHSLSNGQITVTAQNEITQGADPVIEETQQGTETKLGEVNSFTDRNNQGDISNTEEVKEVIRMEEVSTVDETSHEPVYKCAFCDQYHTKTELKKHVKKHVGDKPYHCDYCSKTFSGRGPLQSHIRIHKKPNSVQCTVCKESFRDKSALSTHMKTHTANPPYKCWFCSQAFLQNEHLQNHLRIHAGEKPYKCEECGKSFSYSSNYKVHIRLHTGAKPYKCLHCGEQFRQLHSLKSHQIKHTGLKPFRCGLCDKQFIHKRSLQIHLKLHAAECEIEQMHAEDIPGRCDACKTLFTAKMDLLRRVRINDGEHPYGCRECGECFLEPEALKSHFRIHARESTMGCIICTKEEVDKSNKVLDLKKEVRNMRQGIKIPKKDVGFELKKKIEAEDDLEEEKSVMCKTEKK